MTRECIYVGDNEIIERYVGTTLVWEAKLVEVAHFENLDGWTSYGEIILRRHFYVNKSIGEAQQESYDYNASKAKINGKLYDIQGAQMNVSDGGSVWEYNFIIIFKNRTTRDEVARMYQKDIYLYKRG
nr:MAG TPA: hypothetical protein [Caudoviricetes sp.]